MLALVEEKRKERTKMELERKLQKIGDSYYISLPPHWIKHHKLKKSDSLNIIGKKSVVVIKILKPKKSDTTTELMERKLQNIGDTWYIALPLDWIRRHNLQKGDTLIIQYGDRPRVIVKLSRPLPP